MLDGQRIAELLSVLGHRLEAQGVRADIFVVGGSAMALAYNVRRSTSDIDAIIAPLEPVLEEARAMAAELGLEPNWLSAGVMSTVHGLAPDRDPIDWTELAPGSPVRVRIGSAEYLLAMKAMTSRRSTVDLEDAAELCVMLGIDDEEQVAAIVSSYWGGGAVEAQELFFEDIADRARELTAEHHAASNAGATVAGIAGAAAVLCRHWMPAARRYCSLPAGHRGQHR